MPDRFLSIEECIAGIEKATDSTTKEVFQILKETMEGGEYAIMVNDDGPELLYYTVVMGEPARLLDVKKVR